LTSLPIPFVTYTTGMPQLKMNMPSMLKTCHKGVCLL